MRTQVSRWLGGVGAVALAGAIVAVPSVAAAAVTCEPPAASSRLDDLAGKGVVVFVGVLSDPIPAQVATADIVARNADGELWTDVDGVADEAVEWTVTTERAIVGDVAPEFAAYELAVVGEELEPGRALLVMTPERHILPCSGSTQDAIDDLAGAYVTAAGEQGLPVGTVAELGEGLPGDGMPGGGIGDGGIGAPVGDPGAGGPVDNPDLTPGADDPAGTGGMGATKLPPTVQQAIDESSVPWTTIGAAALLAVIAGFGWTALRRRRRG